MLDEIEYINQMIFNSQPNILVKEVNPFACIFDETNQFEPSKEYIYYGVINNTTPVNISFLSNSITLSNYNNPILFDNATGVFSFVGYKIRIENSTKSIYAQSFTYTFPFKLS